MDILESNDNFTASGDIIGPLYATIVGIQIMTGLVANSFVLILTGCHSNSWKQPSTVFLTNMLLANLAVIIFVMPFIVVSAASGEWIFGKTIEQKWRVCQFAGFMFWFSITLSTVSLTIVSFDRFFYIVWAFYYEMYMNSGIALIVVIVSWIIVAILNIPPFFGFGQFAYTQNYETCSAPKWKGASLSYGIYGVTIYILLISGIIVTSIWTYCFTWRFLRKKQSIILANDNQQSGVYNSQNRRLIGLFGTLILVHLLCYLPGIIHTIVAAIVPTPPPVYVTGLVMVLMETTLSPLVQSFFRRDIREVITKCWKRCKLEYQKI